jgi:hypothetical protein
LAGSIRQVEGAPIERNRHVKRGKQVRQRGQHRRFFCGASHKELAHDKMGGFVMVINRRAQWLVRRGSRSAAKLPVDALERTDADHETINTRAVAQARGFRVDKRRAAVTGNLVEIEGRMKRRKRGRLVFEHCAEWELAARLIQIINVCADIRRAEVIFDHPPRHKAEEIGCNLASGRSRFLGSRLLLKWRIDRFRRARIRGSGTCRVEASIAV